MSNWLAPAKLNLFLHVTGQRSDGYHLLQTVFQFIGFYDEMKFEITTDGKIQQAKVLKDIAPDQDLAIIAARRLQEFSGCKQGVTISIRKNLPIGAGLGGGSSNAATTLIALNQLWKLNLSRRDLTGLGLEIGADVPVFVNGKNAWGEGIGEQLTQINLENGWFVVIIAPVHVSTSEVFLNPKLTRDTLPITMRDFLAGIGGNDLQAATCEQYPQVQQVVDWLSDLGDPLMTGSGSAVFMKARSKQHAQDIVRQCPRNWRAIFAKGLTKHPHI